MYKPLPNGITIKESPIEGLGLFATEDIPANTVIGKIHVPNEKEENGYFRTPLGGFGNHSDFPNCEFYKDDDYIKLRTIRHINIGHELTAEYWLYDIEK